MCDEIDKTRRNIAAIAGIALATCTVTEETYAAKIDRELLQIKDYVELRAYNGDALVAFVLNPIISGEFVRRGADGGILDDGGTIIVDALGRPWERLFNGPVSLEWFGAVGDGATDDTNSILKAFNSGKSILCDNKTYCVKSDAPLLVKNQGRQVIEGGSRTVIKILKTKSTDLFRFHGSVALKNLVIDFSNGPTRQAFRWEADAGHVEIENVHVKNLLDNDSATGTIIFVITPTGNTFTLNNIQFFSIKKRGNGKITDSFGSLNCIYIGGGPGSIQGSIEKISANTIHNINANGSVIYEDTSVIYLATQQNDTLNSINIRNICGTNFGKRLLKIHASNVTIDSVVGQSTEGDTLGVIGFLTDQGLGTKQGCSASNVRAIGNMDYAFSSAAPGVKWRNIVASVQRGEIAGQPFTGVALLINGSDTSVDGFWSDSSSDIAIGTSEQVVKNTTLRNLTTLINSSKSLGNTIFNSSATIGFDGLLIDGFTSSIQSGTDVLAPICLNNYMDGRNKLGRNLNIRNVVIKSDSENAGGGIVIRHIDGVVLSSIVYINTSVSQHEKIISIQDSMNINVDNIIIKGRSKIGILVENHRGVVEITRVAAVLASTAVVYNH